jgi:hypothetical protein
MVRILLLVAALASLDPATGVAQDSGVGLQFAVGSAGGGILLSGAMGSHVGLRGGIHAMPRGFSTRFGHLDYSGDFPSPSWQLGADLFPRGGSLRVSGGVFLLSDQVSFTTGSVEAAVEAERVTVGENGYVPRRVGRLDVRAEGRSVVPWVGIGWGGNAVSGEVTFFVDAGVAMWGTPRIVLEAVGAERGNPAFQADLELERARMEDRFSRFSLYPLLTVGVSLPIVGGG